MEGRQNWTDNEILCGGDPRRIRIETERQRTEIQGSKREVRQVGLKY